MAECPECGTRFDARTVRRNRAPVEITGWCERCGDEFDTTTTARRKRFCSRACQVAEYAARRKERTS